MFVAYPDPEKSSGYRLSAKWQTTTASSAYVDAWRPGLALCAVQGYAFDVLDLDPRNGSDDSWPLLLAELQGEVPEVYGRVRTPSGGWHLWIAALGIGKHTGWLPGLDLQGAKTDGTGRGFVFLPPTVRRSKVSGEPTAYSWTEAPTAAPSGDSSGARLAGLITALADAKRVPRTRARERSTLAQGSAYGRMQGIVRKLSQAPEGERNDLLFWAAARAGEMIEAGGIDPETAIELLSGAADSNGLTAEDGQQAVVATILSGMRAVSA